MIKKKLIYFSLYLNNVKYQQMYSDKESNSDKSSEYNLNNEKRESLSDISNEQEFGDESSTERNSVSISDIDIESTETDSLNAFLYDTDDENSEEEEINAEYYYEAEELSRTKYNIVLCELYNLKKHGKPSLNSEVEYNYLTVVRFKKLNMTWVSYETWDWYNYNMINIYNFIPHNIFRNYEYILRREDLIRPEIAECIYLSGGECVSILKTFWIRIIQRKWKKILIDRKEKLELRKQLKSLYYRETTGKWPPICLYLPSLKGMLSELV